MLWLIYLAGDQFKRVFFNSILAKRRCTISKVRVIAAVGIVFFLASCVLLGPTVGDILDDSERYIGRTVRLVGLLVEQEDSDEFLFSDGTGEIKLDFESSGPLPELYDMIRLEGKVVSSEIDVISFRKLR